MDLPGDDTPVPDLSCELPASCLATLRQIVGAKQVLYCNELISPHDIRGFDGIEISCGENTTANIICMGNEEVIVNRSNASVTGLLRDNGYIVHDLDLSEFAKGMGGPNCLIMPVERGAS